MSALGNQLAVTGAKMGVVRDNWSLRQYASIELTSERSLPRSVVTGITSSARATAQLLSLDGLRLRSSTKDIRRFIGVGWEFSHYTCFRKIASAGNSMPMSKFSLQVDGLEHFEQIVGSLGQTLRAGIPNCEGEWRNHFDFREGAKRWLTDFLCQGNMLIKLKHRSEIAAYGLVSLSSKGAVIEDVSAMPGFAGLGLTDELLRHIDRIVLDRGFDSIRATLGHPMPTVRRSLARRLKRDGWSFEAAHFALQIST